MGQAGTALAGLLTSPAVTMLDGRRRGHGVDGRANRHFDCKCNSENIFPVLPVAVKMMTHSSLHKHSSSSARIESERAPDLGDGQVVIGRETQPAAVWKLGFMNTVPEAENSQKMHEQSGSLG